MTFLYLDGPTQYPERYGFPAHHASPFATAVFVIALVIIFLLRNNQYWGWMWFVVKCFFIALAVVLFADKIKKWWKE